MAPHHVLDRNPGRAAVKAEGLIPCILKRKPDEVGIVRVGIAPEDPAGDVTAVGIDGDVADTVVVDIAVDGHIRYRQDRQVAGQGDGRPAQRRRKGDGMRPGAQRVHVQDGLAEGARAGIGIGCDHKSGSHRG